MDNEVVKIIVSQAGIPEANGEFVESGKRYTLFILEYYLLVMVYVDGKANPVMRYSVLTFLERVILIWKTYFKEEVLERGGSLGRSQIRLRIIFVVCRIFLHRMGGM